jgi:sec-independent protein translocase protein TatB
MFEIGFTEIVVILGIALVVLGPERLPKVAAEIGRWLGRARAMARQFRTQLDDEVRKAESQWSDPLASRPPAPPGRPDSAATAATTDDADTAAQQATTAPQPDAAKPDGDRDSSP